MAVAQCNPTDSESDMAVKKGFLYIIPHFSIKIKYSTAQPHGVVQLIVNDYAMATMR